MGILERDISNKDDILGGEMEDCRRLVTAADVKVLGCVATVGTDAVANVTIPLIALDTTFVCKNLKKMCDVKKFLFIMTIMIII